MILDLTLVNDLDSSKCVLSHHERTYGDTPYETLLIAFKNNLTEKKDLQLVFRDRVFGFGTVKFLFKSEDLLEIPELNLSQYQ